MSLAERIQAAWEVFAEAFAQRPHGFLAFSGGKDSTALLVLAVEFFRRERPAGVRLEVLYADTRLEIPPLARHAQGMLAHARSVAENENLPIGIHVVQAPPENSFWSLMLGRGYPAPSFRFRWCTDRLKVRPMNGLARSLCPDPSRGVMFVGVRSGESVERDRRLKNACGRGECGPAAVGKASIFPAVSPIRDWRTCDVWDFLNLMAPRWGWPTAGLERLYGGDERVRYGCWVCPLVREDRAMAAAIAAADEERPVLEALAAFREKVLACSRDPEKRERRPNGQPGRLRAEVREALLRDLLALQHETGFALITPEELEAIRGDWRDGYD